MKIKHEITKVLYQLGIPELSAEYFYLHEAVLAAVEDPDIVLMPLKAGLYPLLAKRCLVAESTVSKALSRAKKLIWKNGDDDALLSCFGYTADECDAPTTDVFIAAIASSISVLQGTEKTHDSLCPINKTELIELIEKKLNKLGLPTDHQGYCYLRSAILLVVNDSNMISHITDVLYPTIAREHGITEQSATAAIRQVIDVTWDKGDTDALNSYFGYTIQNTHRTPTDREFIAMIADDIRLEIQNKF